MHRLTLRSVVIVVVVSASVGASVPAQAAATSGPRKLWTSLYDRAQFSDFASAVTTSSDGSLVFVTGTTGTRTGFTRQNYTTVAYDPATGDLRWAKPYDGTSHGDDVPVGIAVSPDGASVFVTGTSTGPVGQTDFATVAYEAATGRREWVKRYHGPDNGNDSPAGIAVSPDSSLVYVTGYSQDPNQLGDFATLAYDATSGARVWVRRFGPKGFDLARAIAASHDGSLVFVTGGSTHGSHSGVATVAYDARTGDERWVADYTIRGGFDASGIAVSPDDSEVVIAGAEGHVRGSAVAYDASTGSQLWARSLPRKADGDVVGLTISADGSRVFVESEFFATVALDAATGARLWVKVLPPIDGRGQDSRDIAVSPNGSHVFVEGYSLDGLEYTTVAYDAATGVKDWVRHFDGPLGGPAEGAALAVAPDGSALFVTGFVQGGGADGYDYGTLAYDLG